MIKTGTHVMNGRYTLFHPIHLDDGYKNHSFEIRSDLTGRREPADPRLKPSRVEEKIDEEKTGITRLTRQDPVKNSVAIR
jgi:hypothetical protein